MINQIRRAIHALLRDIRIRRDPIGYARSIGVQVGENCHFVNLKATTFASEPWLVKLGNHVEVTAGVRFITHDGGMWVFREENPDIDIVGSIIIGDNVFIGINSILLPGVKIGNNCVIGAGSVVSRDIPDGVVAVGVPARPVKSIDEYWESIQDRAFYIRSHSPEEKREIWTKHFGL
jgi:acetyltransferase-like isoleucine patch superfamily enzyme